MKNLLLILILYPASLHAAQQDSTDNTPQALPPLITPADLPKGRAATPEEVKALQKLAIERLLAASPDLQKLKAEGDEAMANFKATELAITRERANADLDGLNARIAQLNKECDALKEQDKNKKSNP